jgi:hypothetical protein
MDATWLERGITAIAIAGGRAYSRDVFTGLAVLNDAAHLVGYEPARLFALAADLSGPETVALIKDFAQRPEGTKDLNRWLHRRSKDADGFVYVSVMLTGTTRTGD